ncbi:hypothetical protein cypCar_00047461 [Cyprinus carpio]|nr:hypothetical protein cypCar_00047461 [Cyprinus carpio]
MVEDGTVMRGRVTVYSVPGCPHCIQAKATLSTLGVPVCDVDVNKHRELRARLKKLTGHSAVPQIFFNNLFVGNNEDLQNLVRPETDPERLERLVLSVREDPVPPDALPVPGENSLDSAGEVNGACELSEALRNLILKLYSDHLSEDGKTVDYKAMSQSLCFQRYCDLAVQLQRVDLLSLSREEKLAFFINIYNALVIHGNLRLGFPKNIWQRYRFFNYVSYFIGGEVFTLQDIENGVLRGNRKGVAQLLKPFSRNDPRLQDIDSQLRAAAEAFLENDDSCVIDSVGREVKLSQIFKWYKADFGGTDEKLLNWVFDHMGASQKKRTLQALLSQGKVKVSYLPYDWSINSTD